MTNPMVPPHSLMAEQSVIGGLLLDNSSWIKVQDVLVEGDFYSRQHQYLFRAIRRLLSDGSPADVLTVSDYLKGKGYLDDIGGLSYIGMLAKETPSVANIGSYVKIVKDNAVLRALIQVGTHIAALAWNPDGKDTTAILKQAEDGVFAISQQLVKGKDGFQRLKDVLKAELESMETNYDNPPESGVLGISTGFGELDSMTSGMQGGDLVVVAGRPSMGKSSLAMNFGEAAAKTGKAVAVFSLEMSANQLAQRMLAGSAELPLRVIREPWSMADNQWPSLTLGLGKIHNYPMWIDDSAALTASMVRAMLMRLNSQIREEIPEGVGMVIIDYLQLMGFEGKPNHNNRAEQIGDTTRLLKNMAKEFNVPVVVLSQLSRNVENRPNKRPILSDLRNSGAIEQDADLVVFVYRDEKYHEDSPDKGMAELIIGKQRNGPLGTVRLAFDGYLTKFRSVE